MKIIVTILTIICFTSVSGQILEKEQWRYVNLHTSLLNLIHGELYMDSTERELTDNEIFSTQIKYALVEFDSTSKKMEIRLTEVNDSTINGFWLNGSNDTLLPTLNSGCYMDFVTEVKLNGKWLPFQINQPFSCGMGIGKGMLFPNYKCKISLDRSTIGKIKIPFRLKLQVGKRKIVSNEIEISCTEKQFKMIPNKIKDFTW